MEASEKHLREIDEALLDQRLAQALVDSLTQDFQCLQTSVHSFEREQMTLRRLAVSGLAKLAPPDNLVIGEGFVGRVMAALNEADLSVIDLVPGQEPCLAVQGVTFVCPMVAGGELLGCLPYILPSKLVSDHRHTKFTTTLAHLAALAFLARNHAASKYAN